MSDLARSVDDTSVVTKLQHAQDSRQDCIRQEEGKTLKQYPFITHAIKQEHKTQYLKKCI